MSINDPKTIFQTAITDVVASGGYDSEQVGTMRHGHDGKIYRWVQNTHTAATAVGSVVFHSGEDDGVDNYKYIEDGATAELMFMAGVAISIIASNGFGWIQVEGTNPTINNLGRVATAIAVGDSLIGVDSQLYCAFGAAVGTAPVYTKRIIALEAVATAATPVAATIAGLIQCK